MPLPRMDWALPSPLKKHPWGCILEKGSQVFEILGRVCEKHPVPVKDVQMVPWLKYS